MSTIFERLSSKLHSALAGTSDSEATPDIAMYTANRAEVMAGDTEGVKQFIQGNLLQEPETAREFFQSFRFYVQDYDDDPRELFDIPECRRWFQKIDIELPYLIYFVPCDQYTLYVGSQEGNDGSRLSVADLRTFFVKRDGALRELADKIDVPYAEIKEKLRMAFKGYSGMELGSW